MRRKELIFVVSGGVFAAAILILTVVTLFQVKEIRSFIGSEGITINEGQEFVQDEGEKLPPSIFADSSRKFQKADTISSEDKTIGCRISVTPIQFSQGTKARVKINGKSYDLNRKDNRFVGTFPAPLFKETEPEVVLEDGDSVRTEAIDFEDSEGPCVATDFRWCTSGEEPRFKEGGIDFNVKITFGMGEFMYEAPEAAQVIGMSEGKPVYKKEFAVNEGAVDPDSAGFLWKDSVDVPENAPLDIYIVTNAKHGLVYRYKLGEVSAKQDFFNQENQVLEVLGPDGKVLFEKEADEE